MKEEKRRGEGGVNEEEERRRTNERGKSKPAPRKHRSAFHRTIHAEEHAGFFSRHVEIYTTFKEREREKESDVRARVRARNTRVPWAVSHVRFTKKKEEDEEDEKEEERKKESVSENTHKKDTACTRLYIHVRTHTHSERIDREENTDT